MKKRFTAGGLFVLTGALLGYLIGSGFSTGQETVQYFSAYGWGGILVGVITFFMMYLTFCAYSYAGRTRGLDSLSEVYRFYAGKYVGRLFEVFAWLFVFGCYVFMTTGFGAAMNQHWGVPVMIGSAIISILSVVTAGFGLQRIVDIIGRIAPAIVVFTLFIGIVSAFTFFPKISEGIELVRSGAVVVNKAATNWLTAGISFGGCSLLLVSAFIAQISKDYREYDYKQFKLTLLLASIFIPGCSVLMGLNHLGNISEAATAAIPNLLLASKIMGGVGLIFAILICLEIYTTTVPLMWTAVIQFTKEDKSIKYKLFCLVLGIAVFIIASTVPYATVLGFIMTWCGYSGGIVCVVCVVRYFMIRSQDKKAGRIEA